MASISIESGKFQIFRNSNSAGESPYVSILAATDGAATCLQDFTGRIIVIRIYNNKLQWKRSTDTVGTDWGDFADIETADIKDGIPSILQISTGAIIVCYWKTVSSVDKWFQAVSKDDCITWEKIEITT